MENLLIDLRRSTGAIGNSLFLLADLSQSLQFRLPCSENTIVLMF